MTNTQIFAKQELDILAATVPDAIITPFTKEILALCEAFGKSGQSGGTAPFTATVISKAIKNLLLQKPICPVTGHESEWVDVTEMCDGNITYQNKRCSALFKNGIDTQPYYLDAIIWKGPGKYDTFGGSVYLDGAHSLELISSRQLVKKFPFQPKTFYIDVIYIPITEEEAEKQNIHYSKDPDKRCYYTVIKDPKQLNKVFKYYDRI